MSESPNRNCVLILLILLLAAAVWIGWNATSASDPVRVAPSRPEEAGDSPPAVDASTGESGRARISDAPGPAEHPVTVLTTGVSGEPCPGVRVEAVSVPAHAADQDAVPALTESITGSEGRAELRLPEGRYALRVSHPGWFAGNVEFEVPRTEPVSIRLSPGVRLRVRVVDVEGAPVEGAVLTDRWLATMRGAVTGPDGIGDLGAVHPENAFVWVSKPGWMTNRAYFNRLGMKGDEHLGKLVIRRGGTLVVTARESETGEILEDVGLLVDGKGWDRLTARIGAGGRVELPGALLPPKVTVRGLLADGRRATEILEVAPGDGLRQVDLLFPPGRMIGGIVVSAETGKPVPGAAVFFGHAYGEVRRYATTGPDGKFRFGPVPGDSGTEVNIHVETPGLVMRDEELEAGPDGLERLRIELVSTGVLQGTVRDPEGEPARGVSVSVNTSNGENPRVGLDLDAVTDRAGRYRIDGVPPGRELVILATTDDRGIAWSEEVTVESGAETEVPPIELPGAFTLRARVVSSTGEPVARGWFWLRYRVKTQGMWAEWRVVRDGRFAEVRGIPRPGAVVELEGPGFLKTLQRIGPDTETLVLDRPLRAVGRAVLADGGLPLAEARLIVNSLDRLYTLEGNNARVKTDADGRFDLPGLRPGRYEVRPRGQKIKARFELRLDGEDLGIVRFE